MNGYQEYFTAKQVRERYGVSDMALWRWLKNPDLKFPQPKIITRRRYFKIDEILEWERSR